VACAKAGQQTPNGEADLERMPKAFALTGEVPLCRTRTHACAVTPDEATDGAPRPRAGHAVRQAAGTRTRDGAGRA
jgi:hypothetical protein